MGCTDPLYVSQERTASQDDESAHQAAGVASLVRPAGRRSGGTPYPPEALTPSRAFSFPRPTRARDVLREVADPEQVLDGLERGVQITALALATGWPPRQIQLLASRNGYLFTLNGTPYKPPEKPR
jgi:hypothetical protein